jgi:hypothetical protein
MINLGLNATDLRYLNNLLMTGYWLRTKVVVMDLNHSGIGDISHNFLSGSVTIDTTSDVTRTLSMDLVDFTRALQLAPDDPDDGVAFPTRMVQVYYGVGSPTGSRWFDIPVFCGPVTKADRDGVLLHIEAQGKESLGMSGLWTAKTYKKGWNKISLLKAIMALSGETRFDTVTTKALTGKPLTLARGGAGPWNHAKRLAAGMGLQAFYDGRGYLRVRSRPGTPNWVFNENWISEDPQTSFNIEELINAVEITGAKPKGRKKPVSYKVVAAPAHPLSPRSLARGGVDQYRPYIEQNTDLKTVGECKSYGDTVLRNGLLQSVDAAFPALVVPGLEEDDLIRLQTDTFTTDFRLKQATIPLVCGEYMSIGYTKSVRPSKLSRRLRRV